MTIIESIFLGVVQGLTEFFPVSSSGHLVLLQHFLNVKETGIIFEVLVHFGTLIAIIIAFWEDVVSIIRNPFQKLTLLLAAGTIPTAIIGLSFESTFEKLFSSVLTSAIMLLFTGTLLWMVETYAASNKSLEKMGYGTAVIIGLAQGLAIVPGISRSGTTIAAALLMGLDRNSAARFSFLLSLPVILGATILQLKELFGGEIAGNVVLPYLAAMIAAAVSGYFAIRLLVRFLKQGKLRYFAVYCWALGATVILWQLF